MTQKSNLFVFLDTNTYLHFQPFDEIDWRKLLDASKVNLIFTHTVLKELEKKKIERTTKLVGKRAEKAVKRIGELMEEETFEIRKGVFIDFLADPLSQAHFDKHNLNEHIGDDCLLAEILFFRQNNTKAEILLVTNDLGLKVRAKHLSIKTFTLPEKFQVPPEIDEDKKKIQKLEKENSELKQKKPDLRLAFENKEIKANYFIKAPETFNSFNNWIELGAIRARYPKLEIPETALRLSDSELKEKLKSKSKNSKENLTNLILIFGDILTQTPVSEYERYNAEVEQFYNNYLKYLEEIQNINNTKNLILECYVELINNGTAPAEDVDIFLKLPESSRFIYLEEFPKDPIQPNPPEPPRPVVVILGEPVANGIGKLFSRRQSGSNTLLTDKSGINQPHPNRFFFSDNRQQGFLKLSELKHHYSIGLPKFHILLNSFSEAKSFEINYTILPKNLPQPINGKLHIIIEKQQFTMLPFILSSGLS
jgi:rRNA-processing protein FCF1